MQINLQFDSVF